MRFGVRHDRESGLVISKTLEYSDGKWHLTLNPEDTASLSFDRYLYDIGLQAVGGEYYMIIEAAWFYVDTAITEKAVTA